MSFFKHIRSFMVAVAAVVGLISGANAATMLINHSDPLEATLAKGGQTVLPSAYDFTYVDGGLVSIKLTDDNPNDDVATVSLRNTGGSYIVQGLILALDQVVSYSLAAGNYTLELVSGARADTFEISAVPLPGAALLFGSALMGFLGFSNRRKV